MKKSPWTFPFVLVLAAVLIFPGTGHSDEIKLQVITEKAILRAGPDMNAAVVIQVTAGTTLTSDQKEGNWYRVILPPDESGVQRIAFILDSLVEVFSPAEEPVQKKPPVEEKAEKRTAPALKEAAGRKVKPGGIELGLRLFGGYEFLMGPNTMNDAYKGTTDYYSDLVDLYNMTAGSMSFSGILEPLESGPYLGGDFFVNINPYLGFGLGAGYLSGNEEGSLEFVENLSGVTVTDLHSQKLSAPFLQVTVFGGLPVANIIRIVPYLGGGLYFGTIILHQESTYNEPLTFHQSSQDTFWTAHKNTVGLHGGLNFELYFTPDIAVFFGAGGLAASFKDLVGDMEWTEWDNFSGSDSGTSNNQKLWACERDFSSMGLGTYPTFFIGDDRPRGVLVKNVESGVISISHLRFVFGITLFFMR